MSELITAENVLLINAVFGDNDEHLPDADTQCDAVFAAVKKILAERVKIDPSHIADLEKIVARADRIMPVSVESLVNMSLDSFIKGTLEGMHSE